MNVEEIVFEKDKAYSVSLRIHFGPNPMHICGVVIEDKKTVVIMKDVKGRKTVVIKEVIATYSEVDEMVKQ